MEVTLVSSNQNEVWCPPMFFQLSHFLSILCCFSSHSVTLWFTCSSWSVYSLPHSVFQSLRLRYCPFFISLISWLWDPNKLLIASHYYIDLSCALNSGKFFSALLAEPTSAPHLQSLTLSLLQPRKQKSFPVISTSWHAALCETVRFGVKLIR